MEIAIEKLPVHEQWSLANQILANIADENFQDENLTISPEEQRLINERITKIFIKFTGKNTHDDTVNIQPTINHTENEADQKIEIEQRQEKLNLLLGCMQDVEIDDPNQAYHEHLDEKYAEYF